MNHKYWCHPSARSYSTNLLFTSCTNCQCHTPNPKLKEILHTELAKQGISGNINLDPVINSLLGGI